MNGYELTRAWFEFSCQNIDKVNSNHTAMYLYLVDSFNFNKWPDMLGVPTEWTMQKLGIKNYKTYKKTFDDLISFSKIELIQKSTNNHTSNIIRLIEVVKNTKATTKAHTKAYTNSTTKESTNPLLTYKNIETINTKTLKLINENASLVEQCLESWILNHTKSENDDFEKAWAAYGKKGNKKNAQKRWEKVNAKDFEDIMNHIPVYINSVSDRKYLKDFEGYLNQEHWKSEISSNKSTKPQVEYVHFYSPSTGNSVLTRERFESRKKSYEPLGEVFEILRTEWKDAD